MLTLESPMVLSQRAYAQHRGVSHEAVRKAIKTGRISPQPDGLIDPVVADAQWDANTLPAHRRRAMSQHRQHPALRRTTLCGEPRHARGGQCTPGQARAR